jgi:hypothetical protein
MDRRTLLKLLGGVAALPALGKAIKGTGIKTAKVAGKVLPKVEGMPEWFTPLVNKIMKEGVDVSPAAKRVEDMTTVKKLEIPSATGEPEVITLTQNKITGEITIEANVYGGVADAPFELNYKPPKTDIDVATGKVIKEPGDFSVVEQRPRPIGGPEDADFEFDYEYLRLEDAYSDVEKLEKIATGKIKDAKKIEERAKGRKMIEQSPYEDIINRYPDPDINDYDMDYANGGLASFANGGKARKKSKAEESLSKYKSYSEQELLENIESKYPNQLQSFSLEDYLLNTMPIIEPRDIAPPRSYSPMPNIYDTQRQYQVDLADGGVASMFRERPGYQVGGTIDPFALQRTPFDQYGFSDPVISALTGNIFTSGQRFRDVTDLFSGPDIQKEQSLGYSEPEIQELSFQRDMLADYRNALLEASLGSTFQTNPEKTALDLATSLRQMYMNPTPPAQQSNQQFFQQPVQQQVVTQQPQMSYNEMQKADYYRRMGELEDKFARQGTSATKYIQDMTNLLAQMKTVGGGIDPLGAMQSKYYTGPSSGSVSQGRGIDASFVINRAQQAERDAAARVTPTRMAFGGLASFNQGGQVKSYEEQTLNKKGYETTGMSKKEIFDLYDSVMGTFSRRFAGGGFIKPMKAVISKVAEPVTTPVLPSTPTPQVNVNTNPIARSLEMAGFTREEIMRILGQQGFADGGLTKTVPPVSGPDSQGVETLFKRRYN